MVISERRRSERLSPFRTRFYEAVAQMQRTAAEELSMQDDSAVVEKRFRKTLQRIAHVAR